MYQIAPLSQFAEDEVEILLDAAFGLDRKSRTAYKMRAGTRAIELLSFGVTDATGKLVGSLQSWPVALQNAEGAFDVLTLVGPVAVLPDYQRRGIGRMMMDLLITTASRLGHEALVMVGDPEYYGRFYDFSSAATRGWEAPGPVEQHRLLARINRKGGVAAFGRIVPNP